MCKTMQHLFCSEIVKRAPSILESGEWSDCKFLLGAEPNRVVVGGYKLVMALASPVFEAMFYGALAETRDIPIVDVEPEIFKTMLRYIYTDNINISSWSEACQIYYAAKKYMLKQLMELCSKYLQTNLNTGNVCQVYEHSLLFEDDELTQKCKKKFSDDTKDLLKDNSFIAADLNTVTTIFSLDVLYLDSELDLIEAAARYVKAQETKSKGETSVSPVTCTTMDEVSRDTELVDCGPSNLKFETTEKQYIRSAVRNIRFLTLTPQQYADCAARYSLLTLPEDHAVLMNIVSDKSDVPMPSGFSSSKVDRVFKTSFFTKIDVYDMDPVFSEAHYFRKLKWEIKCSPYSHNDSMELTLFCTDASEAFSWSCDASVELRFFSQTPDTKPLIYNAQYVFTQHKSSCIIMEECSKYDLINNHCLNDDILEIEVLININKLVGI